MPQVDIKMPHLTVQVAEQDLPEHWVAQVDWALVVRQHRFLKYISALWLQVEIELPHFLFKPDTLRSGLAVY